MPAPKNNTNAAKPKGEVASAVIILRAKPVEVKDWKRAAKRVKKTLSEFTRDNNNSAANP